jgi:1-deoxy-D-xylulose-5-phosphate reductoisomerase
VEYRDGSVIAQLSDTDMRIPLLHALGYPARLDAGLRRLDLVKLGKLEFEPVDGGRFPCLELAYRAARSGGTAPAVLNGANETAVEALLAGELPFLKVAAVIRSVLEEHRAGSEPSLSDLVGADRWARRRAREAIASIPSRA